MKLNAFPRKLHRWLSLGAMLFWAVQALTGIVMVFHWELDDALLKGPHRRTDLSALERRLTSLAGGPPQRRVESLWTSAGWPDRWDATIVDAKTGKSEVYRLDGAGDVLRVRREAELVGNGGWIDKLDLLHQNLLAGPTGAWIVGLSGVLLLSNLLMGLFIAWPKVGTWRRSLARPAATSPRRARLFGWHRALGLTVAVPAIVLVASGVERVFSDGFEELIGASAPDLQPIPPAGSGIGFTAAVSQALMRHPGAQAAGIGFPGPDDATWRVRLLAPGEMRRAYGTTTVWINGNDGRVIADSDAATAPFARRLADIVYPFHTGEVAGLPGRLGVLAVGAGLISMMWIGASLWLARRRPARNKY